MDTKFFHSVYLEEDLCMGCINCIKRCPTQAIRVQGGKARIISQFCIDCGECVRTCAHHAKKIHTDSLHILKNYAYTVALPAPSLYAQFNHLEDLNILLTALLYLGFDDVFEVSAAAELVSAASKEYVDHHPEHWPYISTACPTVVRLIRVRFPNLIEHLLPILPPVEIAAAMARKRAMEKTGLSSEQIGIVFISPCPSKVTYIRSPLGIEHSDIDAALAAKDIYPLLLHYMQEAQKSPKPLAHSGKVGIAWGSTGGEANGLTTGNYLAADGIESVIQVLEDLEDEKFTGLKFIELDACNGGCVGGTLNVENPYIAQTKLQKLHHLLPETCTETMPLPPTDSLEWRVPVHYEPVFKLGSSMFESILMMNQIDQLCREFPGLDCGACGAPTCRALAEDIVRGNAQRTDCVNILRSHIHALSQRYSKESRDFIVKSSNPDVSISMLLKYLDNLTSEIAMLDSVNTNPTKGEDYDY